MAHSRAHNAGFHSLFTHIDSEMLQVGLFQLFLNLGKNLIGLSVIFHMYTNLNYEIWEILTFFLFWQIPFMITVPFVGKFIEKVGLKHALSTRAIGSISIYMAFIFILNENLVQSIIWMMPIFVIRAFFRNSSEVAYDIFLSHYLNKKSKGQSVAWMQIAITMATVIAPVLGAFITNWFGLNAVSILAILFVIIGGIVLYYTPDEKFETNYNSQKLIKDTAFKTPINLFIAEWGRVFFDCMLWLVWPIFLILALKDLVSSGLLIGISSGISMIIAFFIGKKIDKNKKDNKQILKHGAWRSSFLNFFRAIWIEPLTLSVIDALSKINDQTIKVPYNVEFYKWVHKKNTIERIHSRWVITEYYYTIQIGIFACLFAFFENSPMSVFILIFSTGSLFLIFTTKISKLETVKK